MNSVSDIYTAAFDYTLSNTMAGRHTMPDSHDNASTVKKEISIFSGGGSRGFSQNASNFLLIPLASIKPERAFSSAGISKLRSRISDFVL